MIFSNKFCGLCASFSIAAVVALFGASIVGAQDKDYGAEVLQEESVGKLEGDRKMRMVMFTMQPGAEVPAHSHGGPGLRYVLDGAINISWADGTQDTFEAGETYYEGPGENHPSGDMSASNPNDEVTRVLIIETLPE